MQRLLFAFIILLLMFPWVWNSAWDMALICWLKELVYVFFYYSVFPFFYSLCFYSKNAIYSDLGTCESMLYVYYLFSYISFCSNGLNSRRITCLKFLGHWCTDLLLLSYLQVLWFFKKKYIDNTIFKNLNSIFVMWFALIHFQKLQATIETLF